MVARKHYVIIDTNVKIEIQNVQKKLFYQTLINKKFEKSYIEKMWSEKFNNKGLEIWKSIWLFTHYGLEENKIRQFKYRLLYCILPCGELLFKWKMKDTPTCLFCDSHDDYKHMFCKCTRLDFFWNKILHAFSKMGIGKIENSLKTVIFGYKMRNKDYYWVNKILSLCYFIIFKSYCIGKDKKIDVYVLFRKEIDYRVHVMEKINSNFFLKLKTFIKYL